VANDLITNFEDLKNHIDIVSVIDKYITLKKNGANYKACCPFHAENTPSFVVSPTKNMYKCFGCGVSGDAVTFIQEHKKLSFNESVEEVADIFNFDLQYSNSKTNNDSKYRMLEFAKDYFIENLRDEDVEYLLNRGLNQESINKWQIGYATATKDLLTNLQLLHSDLNIAHEVSLLGKDEEKQKYYNFFFKRLMFPIFSKNNRVLGFSGRTTTDHNAKYVNSKDSAIFDKSSIFYGLNFAKDNIYKKQKVVVVEGQIDVIMMHQYNFNTTIATQGTAMTIKHIDILKKLNSEVYLLLDADKAGLNASFKNAKALIQARVFGKACILPENEDVADILKEKRTNLILSSLQNGINFEKFVIDEILKKYDLSNPQNKVALANELKEFFDSIDINIANSYKEYIKNFVDISVNQNQNQNNNNFNYIINDIEFFLIKKIFNHKSLVDSFLDYIDIELLQYKEIFKDLINEKHNHTIEQINFDDNIKVIDDETFLNEIKLINKKQKEIKKKNIINSNLSIEDKLKKIRELNV
jgi:DNA primase